MTKNLVFNFCLFSVLFLLPPAWSTENELPLEQNTITRQFDHIVVKGSELKENIYRSIPLLGLYAFKAGKMEPIPFQVDEITEKGNWVLPHKSPYLDKKTATKSKLLQEKPPLVIDENDELVFMITDIGDRAAAADWPLGWQYADELTLTDPLSNDQGWVYLFSFLKPQALSPVDYVEYQLPADKKDKIYTDNYTMGFSHEVPLTQDFFDFGDGINRFDRLKMRMFFRFFYIIKFARNENEFQSCVWQYKDGPIRVVRMVRSSVNLVRNLQSPKVNSETLYYSNATLMPIRITLPKMIASVLNDAYISSGGDYRNLNDWKARLNTDERWLSIDGKMDEVEKDIKTKGARWYIMRGQGKAIICYLHFLEDYNMTTEFHYLDDKNTEYPPEFHPGQIPYMGFRINDLHKIGDKRSFGLNIIIFYLSKEYSDQELLRAMNIFDNPLKKEVQGFKKY